MRGKFRFSRKKHVGKKTIFHVLSRLVSFRIFKSMKEKNPQQLLRLPDVLKLVPIARSVLYGMVKEGTFPRPVKLGRRSVAWRRDDVQNWIDSRPAA